VTEGVSDRGVALPGLKCKAAEVDPRPHEPAIRNPSLHRGTVAAGLLVWRYGSSISKIPYQSLTGVNCRYRVPSYRLGLALSAYIVPPPFAPLCVTSTKPSDGAAAVISRISASNSVCTSATDLPGGD
jgi:hypothetical protein